jgi:transcriptional regulator with XRE-family HTH domain
MTLLARWLEKELHRRDLSLRAASAASGISIATLSNVLRKGHIPKSDTLLRLADYLGAPRDQVLALAAGLPHAAVRTGLAGTGQAPGGSPTPPPTDEFLVQELIEEFRQVPDEWKEEALAQVAMFHRLATIPPVRFVGEDQPDHPQEEPDDPQG